MRIARFQASNRTLIAINNGEGFIDYDLLLELKGYVTHESILDPENKMIRMLKNGLFDKEFVTEILEWAKRTAKCITLDENELNVLLPYRPRKMICMARNYIDHAKEGGHKPPSKPTFFVKTDNCPIGPNQKILMPTDIGRIDHEGELGVVIKKKATRVNAADAMNYIWGYIVVNDVTAREFQKQLSAEGMPWFAAKSIDTFAPIGPYIVTDDEVDDISSRRISVTVNGNVRQNALMSDMIWNVAALIEAITRNVTLNPGDIIATGTPAGVGPINPGDEVIVEIDGIGKLINGVEAV